MLTVLHVGYPLAPVSLDATGGAEQVMALLDRALTARGHRSIAIAAAGSRVSGHLVPIPLDEPFNENSRRRTHETCRHAIAETLKRWNVDVVHMHGVDFYEYLPPASVPVLATLHLPPSFYPESTFRLSRPETYLHCVSDAQRSTCPACDNLAAVIENGIPLDLYPERHLPKENYALALGRICPEKGFHLALDAAEQAGIPLWIAGAVFPYSAHEQYFRETLAPRFNSPHRFLGPVGCSRKIELLLRARCLLITSLVPETSSLVAMEAMACGTPVVSFPSGALAGTVKHGRTGFLAADVSEMAAGITHAAQIDPRECRREAVSRFSAERMADQYLDLYRALATHTVSPAICV